MVAAIVAAALTAGVAGTAAAGAAVVVAEMVAVVVSAVAMAVAGRAIKFVQVIHSTASWTFIAQLSYTPSLFISHLGEMVGESLYWIAFPGDH
jgi:hypothetical protein